MKFQKYLLITKLDCGLSWIKHSATELASFANEKNQDKGCTRTRNDC